MSGLEKALNALIKAQDHLYAAADQGGENLSKMLDGINRSHASQVFKVAPAVTVTLSGLTIADGSSSGMLGGGIDNDGTLIVSNSTISGNYASPRGGGIYNSSTGTLLLSNSIRHPRSPAHDSGSGMAHLLLRLPGGGVWASGLRIGRLGLDRWRSSNHDGLGDPDADPARRGRPLR
jgi:hypothetical protein